MSQADNQAMHALAEILRTKLKEAGNRSFLPGQSTPIAARFVGFAAWTAGTTTLITYLMALHAMPLPASAVVPAPKSGEARTARSWRAVHVLAAGCPCSGAVAEYLAQRGPVSDLDEAVYVASDDPGGEAADEISTKLAARCFRVIRATPERLKTDLGVRGGPWLLLIDPLGRTRYSGGYASRRPRPGMEFDDLSILGRLKAGEQVSAKPVFGCAIDPALKNEMDPLALK